MFDRIGTGVSGNSLEAASWECLLSAVIEAGEKRVGPGDYLYVPGGHKHWSGGDKKEGALFYDESSGKFDLIPAK